MASVKPIRPDEVARQQQEDFPDIVFEVFNKLIARKFNKSSSKVLQEDVIRLLAKQGIDRKEILEEGWLNIDAAYEEAGWAVEYKKPSCNETGEPCFIFRR